MKIMLPHGATLLTRHFPIAYREQIGNMDKPIRQLRSGLRRPEVVVLDPAALFAVAAFISSVSALVWAVRRKP